MQRNSALRSVGLGAGRRGWEHGPGSAEPIAARRCRFPGAPPASGPPSCPATPQPSPLSPSDPTPALRQPRATRLLSPVALFAARGHFGSSSAVFPVPRRVAPGMPGGTAGVSQCPRTLGKPRQSTAPGSPCPLLCGRAPRHCPVAPRPLPSPGSLGKPRPGRELTPPPTAAAPRRPGPARAIPPGARCEDSIACFL